MTNKQKHPVLSEAALIELMREVWDERIKQMLEMNLTFKKASGEELPTLSKDLKIKHKKSGLLYTVVALDIDMNDVLLKSPDGAEFAVSADELEKEYELD